MVNKYGADALRLYLINSPVVSCPGCQARAAAHDHGPQQRRGCKMLGT